VFGGTLNLAQLQLSGLLISAYSFTIVAKER